jgi:signal transduction histidine kinase
MTNLVEKILTAPGPQTSGSGSLFDAHPVASLIVGRDGVIRQANGAALILFRTDADAIVGNRMVAFIPELDSASWEEATGHRRVAVRRPDGHNFIARLHMRAVRQRRRVLAVARDAPGPERVRSRGRSGQSRARVVHLGGRSRSAGTVAHPQRIHRCARGRVRRVAHEEGKTFLKEILKASDRMEGLIDGLLAMSRAGRAEMICENIDLSTLVDLVYYELRHEQGDRHVDCHVEPGIHAWADVRLMMTILRNVIGNAWKYTSRTDKASIRFHTRSAGRTHLVSASQTTAPVSTWRTPSGCSSRSRDCIDRTSFPAWPGPRDRVSES